MELLIYKEIDELMKTLAEVIKKSSDKAISANGQFNFVLAGGGSPRKLYNLLAAPPYKDTIDWENTYFFFGDERFVPKNNSQRNSLMAKEALFEPLNIKESHIFEVDTTGTPEEAAQKYAQSIQAHFKDQPIKFDFVLLGLGDDAHTASLFPHTPVLLESEPTVKSEFVEKVDMPRITMTAPLINQAHNIAFLVFGKEKAEAVYHVLKDKRGSPIDYPARLIHMKKINIRWFLDIEAASKL